jgi:PAS domain-containing protein
MTLKDIPGIKSSHPEHFTSFLENLLDAAVSGIVVTDNKGIVRYAKPAFLRMFKCDSTAAIIGNIFRNTLSAMNMDYHEIKD